MPAYAAGATRTPLFPGDQPLVLFNGSETVAQGLASIPFWRGPSPSSNDGGTSFLATGMASDMTIDVQASNDDVTYVTTQSMSADTDGHGGTSDAGRSQFYRVLISTYTTGTMPVVTASR